MKTKKLFKKIALVTFVFSLLLIPHTIHILAATAPNSYVPLAPLPGTCAGGGDCAGKPVDLGSYIQGMFKLLIGVAAALAVIMIVIGGITYMSSDAISGKSDGKDMITQAIYGLLLAMASWLILYTVNPQLLQFTALNNIPDVPASQNTPTPPTSGAVTKVISCVPTGGDGSEELIPITSYPWGSEAEHETAMATCNTATPQVGIIDPAPTSYGCAGVGYATVSCVQQF